MSKQFYSFVKNEAGDSELILDGVIASESWWDDEVTPKQFREELDKHTGNITVRINSPGGDVFAGVTIMNMLKDRAGGTTIIVDGLAASIASVIAMAGDKIIMNTGSMMMIHNAWTFAAGDSQELRKVADQLDKIGESIISVYADRTGLGDEELKELLDAETWMTADEAVEYGFADEAIEGKTRLSNMVKNVMNLSQDVQNAVLAPAMSLKTKLKNETTEVEEQDVTDTTETPDEVTPEEPATADDAEETEAETDTAEVVEPVVEVINKSTKETQMSKQDEVAATQVIEPKAQAPVAAAEVKKTYAEYLKSPKAVEDFAQALADTAGEDAVAVKAALREVAVKNGLTDADYFRLPDPIVTQIEDAVRASGIFNALTHTGLDIFRVDWDDTDENTDTSRAGGHKKGTEKAEQVLDFEKRVIRAQYIYKYLTLDKQTVRENRSTGALIRFVMNELPTRIIREIERAVVIGDGRAAGADRKIQPGTPEGFYPIKADTTAGNIFGSTYVPKAGESKVATLIQAVDELEADGAIYLIHKKSFMTDVKLEIFANGNGVILGDNAINETFGISGRFQPTWFTDATDPDNDAYLVVLSGYKTVGDSSIESFTNFVLKENKYEYLQEIYKGGGLSVRKAAVAIAKPSAS